MRVVTPLQIDKVVDGFPDGELVGVNINTQPCGLNGGDEGFSATSPIPSHWLCFDIDTHKITVWKSIDQCLACTFVVTVFYVKLYFWHCECLSYF